MRIVNHHDGNYKCLGSDSACYYGTIYMTQAEYDKARADLIEYIEKNPSYEFENTRWILDEPIITCPFTSLRMTSFRVTFTSLMFKLYNLPR